MAEIVGEDPKAKPRTTCHGCGSILEYHRGEVIERYHRDYTGDLEGWEVVICPKCGEDVRLL